MTISQIQLPPTPTRWLLALLLALAMCLSNGCTLNESQRIAASEVTLTELNRAAVVAYDSGKLDGTAGRLVNDLLDEAGDALDEAQRAHEAGETVAARYWRERIESIVRRVSEVLEDK